MDDRLREPYDHSRKPVLSIQGKSHMEDALLTLNQLAVSPLLGEAAGGPVVALLSRVFHTTCAATMLGGTIYLRFVLAPAAEGGDAEATCFAGRRKAWAACVGVCTGLLLVSGFYNFFTIIKGTDFDGPYHAVFGVKFLLAFVVFAVSALIAGKTSLAEKMRGNLKTWLNVALAAALAVFVLGAYLKSIDRVPKPEPIESEAPAFAPDAEPADPDSGPAFPELPSP